MVVPGGKLEYVDEEESGVLELKLVSGMSGCNET